MLNRRLWILFFAFLLGFAALVLRLAQLQFRERQAARERVVQFLHPQDVIETYRGHIVDRQNRILARDVPSDELAIDYRAIALDDAWLTQKAVAALRASNEWPRFADRAERTRRIGQMKADLVARIDAIPDAVAAALAPIDGLSVAEETERIHNRYDEILQRITLMKQDIWMRRYNRDAAAEAPFGSSSDADLSDEALDSMFRQIQLKDEVAAHSLRANLPGDLALYFKRHAADFPGLMVRDKAEFNRREYPFGEATVHLVGTLRAVDAATLNGRRFQAPDLLKGDEPGDLSGYLPGDRMGETGVERLAESLLHGTRGARLLELGKTDDAAAGSRPTVVRRVDPVPGKTVQLTIDAALQRNLYRALTDSRTSLSASTLKYTRSLLQGDDEKPHFAAMVVLSMDGQLLAVVTYPSFDPNTYDRNRVALGRDEYRLPLYNRATRMTYAPGSTVKPLLASAALAEKLLTPSDEIHCTGHFFPTRSDIFRCDGVHNDVALVDALAKSCNVYFYTVGQRLGLERLTQWYGDFGFGRETGMELSEAAGSLPRPERVDADDARADALLMGIGQGPIDVTPLQMAQAYATLLRGGTVVAPRLLAATPPRQSQGPRISAEELAVIREGMERCASTGTASQVFGRMRLRVGGKTGTAERSRPEFDEAGNPVEDPARPMRNVDGTPKLKADGTPMFRQLMGKDKYDAWFVGYAPADKPQYVVAAVLEWGGHGGRAAAPMVREAFLQLQAHGYLPRTDVP